jgi:hypothetical protein
VLQGELQVLIYYRGGVKLQWASVFDLNVWLHKAPGFVIVNKGYPFLNVLGLSLMLGIAAHKLAWQ